MLVRRSCAVLAIPLAGSTTTAPARAFSHDRSSDRLLARACHRSGLSQHSGPVTAPPMTPTSRSGEGAR